VYKNIVLIFGGTGHEDVISILSAKSIFENIDRSKYHIFPVFMNIESKFIFINENESDFFEKLKSSSDYDLSNLKTSEIFFNKGGFFLENEKKFIKIDKVFNIIHGHPGETGELSGFFDILKIPYVGSCAKSSSILMDKEFMYIIAKHYDIPCLDFEKASESTLNSFEYYNEKFLSLPIFLKACNAGSSRGVFKINNKQDFEKYKKEIFNFDSKIIIQKGLESPREIEISVFYKKKSDKKKELYISKNFGEIKLKDAEFYSYDAKYFNSDGVDLIFDSNLDENNKKEILYLSKKIFEIFDCSYGRIDYLLDIKTNKIFFNEVNTIPGFTKRSMFPLVLQKDGISYSQIIDFLIEN
jgi:D-alanine-D-alanine ligase